MILDQVCIDLVKAAKLLSLSERQMGSAKVKQRGLKSDGKNPDWKRSVQCTFETFNPDGKQTSYNGKVQIRLEGLGIHGRAQDGWEL